MNKIISAVVVIVLSVIIVITAIAPAIAGPPSANKEYVYGYSGTVVLNLPTGGKCNTTNIKLNFMHVDERSTKGAENFVEVSIWRPEKSTYYSVGMIDDNPIALASVKTMLTGLPYMQFIQVNPGELMVWKDGDTIIANLTVKADFIFKNLDGTAFAPMKAYNFTLPPMTITYVKTGPIYDKTDTTTVYNTWPGALGYTVNLQKWIAPGFASVSIPAWIGSTTLPVAAYYNEKVSEEVIIP